MNTVSAGVGIIVIPVLGLVWEIFPGIALYKFFNIGTLNPDVIALYTMNPQAGTHIEITVQLGKAGLYWYWLRALTRFPVVLAFLVPIGGIAFSEARSGSGF